MGSATLALIKPELVAYPQLCWEAVKRIVICGRMDIIVAEKLRLTIPQAREFYSDHRQRFYFGRLVAHMTSGPCIAMILGRNPNPKPKPKPKPNPKVRKLPIVDNQHKLADDDESILNIFCDASFPVVNRCGTVSDHGSSDCKLANALVNFRVSGRPVVGYGMNTLLPVPSVNRGYAVNRTFVSLTSSDGPSFVDVLSEWRSSIGKAKVYASIWEDLLGEDQGKMQLRVRYALSDHRNAFHGADSMESFRRECSVLGLAAHFGDSQVGGCEIDDNSTDDLRPVDLKTMKALLFN